MSAFFSSDHEGSHSFFASGRRHPSEHLPGPVARSDYFKKAGGDWNEQEGDEEAAEEREPVETGDFYSFL